MLAQAMQLGDVGTNVLKPRPDYYSTYYGHDALGGGCLQDDLNHEIMASEIVAGPVAEVTAQRHNIGLENIDTDDKSFAWLKFTSGVVATLDLSLQCHFGHGEWIVSGSTGAIRLDIEPEATTIRLLDAATEDVHEEVFAGSWNETFRRNDENFVEAIRGNASVCLHAGPGPWLPADDPGRHRVGPAWHACDSPLARRYIRHKNMMTPRECVLRAFQNQD